MKVSFFNRSYWPDKGSTGQLLTELAEDLVAVHGCEVEVVAGYPLTGASPGSSWRPVTLEQHNGVRIIRATGTRFSPRRFAGRASNYVTYFLSACYATFRIGRADVVVALTDPPIIGLAAAWLSRRLGARFVFVSEDVFPEVALLLEDFRSERVNRVLDRVNRYLLRRADRVVALGKTMRDRLVAKRADPAKIAIIHNWADCTAIVPEPKRNPFSIEHGLADKFVVMHSGNVGRGQGLEALVEAAALVAQYPDVLVAIVGQGIRRQTLERRVAAMGLSNVRFLDHQPRSQLRWSFASADVFLVSLRAGLAGYIVPSKLYGILAAGRPYIAAVDDASEVASVTRQHECGIHVPPEDPAALAAAIVRLYSDSTLTAAMGTRARAAALEFDRPRQVRAYYELFTEVAAERSPKVAAVEASV